jgi:2-dehydro-3-deoxygalactonokinase
MASSTIGWMELPYAQVPFHLDGGNLEFHQLQWDNPCWISTTWLISGVRTAVDMMRGEETEAVGLLADPSLAGWRERCLLVLPGTHSKHLVIRNNAIVDFHTCMTGELFNVLASHSLLKASTDPSTATAQLSPEARHAFSQGVLWAKERGLSRGLFRTRTRSVLDRRPAPENTWFLSGLLIGSELEAVAEATEPILLGGAGRLGQLYELAARLVLQDQSRILVLPAAQVDRAAVLGQMTYLSRLCL